MSALKRSGSPAFARPGGNSHRQRCRSSDWPCAAPPDSSSRRPRRSCNLRKEKPPGALLRGRRLEQARCFRSAGTGALTTKPARRRVVWTCDSINGWGAVAISGYRWRWCALYQAGRMQDPMIHQTAVCIHSILTNSPLKTVCDTKRLLHMIRRERQGQLNGGRKECSCAYRNLLRRLSTLQILSSLKDLSLSSW